MRALRPRIFAAGVWCLILWLGFARSWAQTPAPAPAAKPPESFTVSVWNVRNFGVSDHMQAGRFVSEIMKPPEEMDSMFAILARMKPDIAAFNEIITAPDNKFVELLRKKLREAGLDYPHLVTFQGEDHRIQNVLLSRFPIASDDSTGGGVFNLTRLSSSTGEKMVVPHRMSRGVLDCVIEVRPGWKLRVIVLHLKSKRSVPSIAPEDDTESGEEIIRRHEAVIARGVIQRHLDDDPTGKMLVMGDFNDLPASNAVRTIAGPKSAAVPLHEMVLTDLFGDRWTHYYFAGQSYERIDYLLGTQAMYDRWVREKSYLWRPDATDPPRFNAMTASDHRPLFATFRFDAPKP